MVLPFNVNPDYDDDMSFEESVESVVQVREDTPPLPVQRRLFGTGASATPSTASAAQSRQRRGNRGLRSLCCGIFPRRRRSPINNNNSSAGPPTGVFASMTQRNVPAAHSTIFEEDEDEDEEENSDQENQPPVIAETLDRADEHDDGTSHQADQELDEEYDQEQNFRRRRSLRHSWITVSRWLE
jgi:hypothetical protein